MSALTSEARELLDAARTAYDPVHEDRVRVRAALAATLPAAGAAAAGASTGVLKVVVFGVSVAVGSLGVLGGAGMVRSQPRPALAAPTPVAAARAPAPAVEVPAVAPAEAPAPLEAAPVEIAPASPAPSPKVHKGHAPEPSPVIAAPSPVVNAPPPPPAPAPAAVAAPSPCAPDSELAVVQRAQRWLASSPAEALKQLDAFDGACPDGALVEERLATRAIALCMADRLDEGQAQLNKLQARNPKSPALLRVREACAEK